MTTASPMFEPGLFRAFVDQVYHHTGITIGVENRAVLHGRVRRRSRALELASDHEYLSYLQDHAGEIKYFIDAVTTNKTSMFRTPGVWDYLYEVWLPRRMRAEGPVRIWSGACSAGHEVAAIAVTLAEFAKTTPFVWRVVGSDMSAQMVRMAKDQTFDAQCVEDGERRAPGIDVERYFEGCSGDGRVRLCRELRRNLDFRQHNLFHPAPIDCADVAFVRNVVLYYSPRDKARVLDNAVRALRPGGLLVLGESESLVVKRSDLRMVRDCVYTKD